MLGEIIEVKIIDKIKNEYIARVDEERTDFIIPSDEGPFEPNSKQSVFVYKHENNHYYASLKKPKILLGEIKCLEVKSIGGPGIFLDWGLDWDLFLPYSLAKDGICEGKEYLFTLIVDKNRKLSASMKINSLLKNESPYEVNDWVEGIVYSLHPDFGAFIAVDNMYDGLINKQNLTESLGLGDKVRARVLSKNENRKLNLGLRDLSHSLIDEDARTIYNLLLENDGFLPFGDKSDPNAIREKFSMSKSSFKKAVGNLYKKGLIRVSDKSISKK